MPLVTRVHHSLNISYNIFNRNTRRCRNNNISISNSNLRCRLRRGSLKSWARQFPVHQVGNGGSRDKVFSMHSLHLSLVVWEGVG